MNQPSKMKIWILGTVIFPIISGLLMAFGWPNYGIAPFLFVGLIPLFLAFEEIDKISGKSKYFALFFANFSAHFTWLVISLKWLGTTSPQSFLTAISIESLSLSLAVLPAIWVGLKYGKIWRFIFFVVAWMSVEFLNQNWLLGTPYFSLGSGFGMYPKIIQHYEFIGIEGGTVWLLVCNFMIYNLIDKIRQKTKMIKPLVISTSVIFIPILISLSLYQKQGTEDLRKISVLHTFLNSNTKEYSFHPERITDSLMHLSQNGLNQKSELIVWPEVVIPNLGWLLSINQEKAFRSIYLHLKEYPQTTICTGGYGFTLTKSTAEEDPYATYDPLNKYFYLTHNIALSVTFGDRSPIRSKKFFVPFQERIPFLKEFPFMANFADLVGGNAKISYYPNGVEVHHTKTNIAYAPMLCYESVFPLMMVEKAKESDLIVIAANENWNKDLSGSKQYLYNNVGMAIQSRIPIAKSSNSGVSAIIDKYGNILEERTGRNSGLITQNISLADRSTFYSAISSLLYWFSVILFLPIYTLFLFSVLKTFFVKKS